MAGWLQDASKVRTYGKPFFGKDGILYRHTLPWWQRPLYRVVKAVQWTLWKLGVNWHDPVFDECAPTGGCC